VGKSYGIGRSAMSLSNTQRRYRRADKFLVRPGWKQPRKHLWDARNIKNIETRAIIIFFSPQCKAPKEIHAIVTETLGSFHADGAKFLLTSLYFWISWQQWLRERVIVLILYVHCLFSQPILKCNHVNL